MRTWVLAAAIVAGLAGSASAAECAHFEAAEARIRAIIEGATDSQGGHVRVLAVQLHDARGPERGSKQCKVTVVTTAGDQHWELLENPTAGNGMVAQRDRALEG